MGVKFYLSKNIEIIIARDMKAKATKPMAESSYIIRLYNPKSIATSFALLYKI